MKNKAFTVAETLMVTSIIGVLAAIMLGQMSKLTPDKRKIMYKKAYQTIEKTIGELVNDEDLYPYTGDPETYGFKNTITVIYPPGSSNSHGGGTKICTLFERKLNVTDKSTSECGWFTTADGISYNVDKINDNKIKE